MTGAHSAAHFQNNHKAFKFRKRHLRLNWASLLSLNLQRDIIESHDAAPLLQHVHNLAFSDILPADFSWFTDLNIVQLIRCYQLTLEVFMSKCETQMHSSDDDVELRRLKRRTARKSKQRQDTQTTATDTDAGQVQNSNTSEMKRLEFECSLCDSAFVTAAYLQQHTSRRHKNKSKVDAAIAAAKKSSQNDNQSTQLPSLSTDTQAMTDRIQRLEQQLEMQQQQQQQQQSNQRPKQLNTDDTQPQLHSSIHQAINTQSSFDPQLSEPISPMSSSTFTDNKQQLTNNNNQQQQQQQLLQQLKNELIELRKNNAQQQEQRIKEHNELITKLQTSFADERDKLSQEYKQLLQEQRLELQQLHQTEIRQLIDKQQQQSTNKSQSQTNSPQSQSHHQQQQSVAQPSSSQMQTASVTRSASNDEPSTSLNQNQQHLQRLDDEFGPDSQQQSRQNSPKIATQDSKSQFSSAPQQNQQSNTNLNNNKNQQITSQAPVADVLSPTSALFYDDASQASQSTQELFQSLNLASNDGTIQSMVNNAQQSKSTAAIGGADQSYASDSELNTPTNAAHSATTLSASNSPPDPTDHQFQQTSPQTAVIQQQQQQQQQQQHQRRLSAQQQSQIKSEAHRAHVALLHHANALLLQHVSVHPLLLLHALVVLVPISSHVQQVLIFVPTIVHLVYVVVLNGIQQHTTNVVQNLVIHVVVLQTQVEQVVLHQLVPKRHHTISILLPSFHHCVHIVLSRMVILVPQHNHVVIVQSIHDVHELDELHS
jgi:hypothetical protein